MWYATRLTSDARLWTRLRLASSNLLGKEPDTVFYTLHLRHILSFIWLNPSSAYAGIVKKEEGPILSIKATHVRQLYRVVPVEP